MHPAEVDPDGRRRTGTQAPPGREAAHRRSRGAAAVEVGARVFAKKLGGGWKTVLCCADCPSSRCSLAAASAYTRFGMLEAGIESTKDPRHVVQPQRAASKRSRGGASPTTPSPRAVGERRVLFAASAKTPRCTKVLWYHR